MSLDYLNEAFKRLDLLNEDTFDTSLDGINKLSKFMSDNDDVSSVRVIDTDAANDEDLKDSYIGKIITNCNVCHSHIFNDKDEIVISDEGDVNTDVVCPYCGEMSGFTVVGEIVNFPLTDETTEETTEVVNESIVNEKQVSENNTNENNILDDLISALVSKGYVISNADCLTYLTAAKEYIITVRETDPEYSVKQWLEDTEKNYPEDLAVFKQDAINESVENINIETDSDIVTVAPDEAGKIDISVEPKDTDIVSESETEEVIAPVSDETIADIENLNTESEETTVKEESIPEEEVTAEEVDIELDEIDEESLDNLGESYMNRVYENVKSFKTNNVFVNENMLVVEGTITFNSGAKKTTGFIFEAKDTNAKGKVRFSGMNEHFSKQSDAYTLSGKVDGTKFIPESLSYKYAVNESQTVRGRVTTKR